MILVGCDFHSRYQQIACVDTETGDLIERRLEHENGEAFEFYRSLTAPARVGIEATRGLQWFARMLNQLGRELIVGDARRSGRWWFGVKRQIREMRVIYLSC